MAEKTAGEVLEASGFRWDACWIGWTRDGVRYYTGFSALALIREELGLTPICFTST